MGILSWSWLPCRVCAVPFFLHFLHTMLSAIDSQILHVDDDDDDVDRSTGAADSAWMLLQTYLCRHGDNSSHYHRCTAAKLLQHGFTLPSWLTAAYKVLSLCTLLYTYLLTTTTTTSV